MASPPVDAEPPTTAAPAGLAKGALGLPSVLFCIVTGAAPITAMLFNVPVAINGAGYAAPVAFIIATVALTVFSVGYIEMAGRVTSAGGFYTYITRGLGRIPGLSAGFLITLCYMIFAAGVLGLMGYFAATALEDWFSITVPAYVCMAVGLALMSALAWMHIELTAKVLGVALVAEVLVLSVLAIAILVQGGDSGLTAKPLDPTALFDNDAAIKTFGAAAVGVALFGAFWSWVGFEMAPNYAEESRNPKKIAKIATYVSVIGLGLFYILISYSVIVGLGTDKVTDGVASYFAGTSANIFDVASDRYVGGWLTKIIEGLAVTSSFACAMAFYNTSARYLFALGRERSLPSVLSKPHPKHHSPYIASSAVTVFVALFVLGFQLDDHTTAGALTKIATWTPLMGVMGILAVQATVSFAVVRYFLTEARDGFHLWKTFIAPILGGAAQVGAIILLVHNRTALAAGNPPFIKYMPWIVLGMALLGAVVALWMKLTGNPSYERIGAHEHLDDVPPSATPGTQAPGGVVGVPAD
jgi:amino acid transporter